MRNDERYLNKYYFDHRSVKVHDFLDWFTTYHPEIEAGWVTTYDRWRIFNKGYIPENPQHYLHEDDVMEDMHFVEYENPYDCSKWLYNYLIDNKVPDEADITYWFDC